MAVADIGKLNEIIHGRLRLGIVTYLAAAEVAEFNELKAALDATQGNLSAHLRKLEEAGYVAIEKGYAGRRPLTRVRLTRAGRSAFASYLEAMSRIIGDLPKP